MRYHTRRYTREELQQIIESSEGYRVGWELNVHMNGVIWRWAQLMKDHKDLVWKCELVRDATPEEAELLSHLLKGDIVVRHQGVLQGNAWGLASVE